MERLSRYDVAENKGVKMVVVESDLLPPDPAVVVIPLLADYPAVKDLNPEVLHDGERLVSACHAPDCSSAALQPAPLGARGRAERSNPSRCGCVDGWNCCRGALEACR